MRIANGWAAAGAAVLLALMAVLAGGAALRESVTIDEVAHIGAGLSYWQKLDMRMNEEHPPLPKLLAGLPLALRGTRADYSGVAWRESEGFFGAIFGEWAFGDGVVMQWNDADVVLRWARFPMLLLTLVLGGVLFVYARRLGGPWAGLLCLAAYATAPVFLTFGPLVLTDVAITLFTLVTLWQLGDLWREPSLRHTRLLGLALAGALLSKFSAGILVLAMLAFVVATRWWPAAGQPAAGPERKAWRRLRWRALRRSVLLAALVVYGVYLLFSWNQPIDIPKLQTGLAAVLGRLLMPVWILVRGLLFFFFTSPRPTFLLGQWHAHGVWFYFPVAFALKSSLGLLGLLVTALGLALAHARGGATRAQLIAEPLRTQWRVLWVALLVFVVVCALSPMNISVRHFSVPIVLLMLLMATLPGLVARLSTAGRAAVSALTVALVAACLYTAVAAYPFYLPYINPLAFGHPVHERLNDSNVDWNQALPEVARFAAAHGLAEVTIDAYGMARLTPWLPTGRYWDCQLPEARDAGRWVFVSANMLVDSHNCEWMMRYPHESLGGGSVYAFQLPDPIPAAGEPGGPPLAADRHVFPSQRDADAKDFRAIMLEAVLHPENIPEINKKMAAEFERQQAARKK